MNSVYSLNLSIDETWLQRLADKREFVIRISEQYSLHKFRLRINSPHLEVTAEILQKPESWIEVTCKPRWDDEAQQLFIDDLTVNTKSNNVIVKSAGWLASTFFHGKIDQVIEKAIMERFYAYIQKLLSAPVSIPLGEQGKAEVNATGIKILNFQIEQSTLKALIEITGMADVELQ